MPRTQDIWSVLARRLLALALTLALALPAPLAVAAKGSAVEKWQGRLPITELSQDEAILHALNRLAFGPRPGDVERVRAMGLEKWIEQQLAPGEIDDSAAAKRLERYPTLAMSSAELLEKYPRPADAMRRAGMSREEIQKWQEAQQKQRQEMEEMRQQVESGERPSPEMRQRMQELRGMRGQEDFNGPQRVIAELSVAKLTRAIYSERQLEEMLVDFWFNHFNVFAGKGADRWLLTSYERDTIRPNVLGNFHALLSATAKSPAMLFYLDNWQSADPEAFARMEQQLNQGRQRFLTLFGGNQSMPTRQQRRQWQENQRNRERDMQQREQQMGQLGQRRPGQQPNQRRQRGLNENYARELMELHTLGVDGGYTQDDIIEVARAFTGWTMRPRTDAEFYFDARIHDAKPKTVLGKKVDAGGVKDGEEILAMLAAHPNTAKFISTKLARRFVSDAPPEALVARMAQSFTKTGGDLRAVVRTMIYSPEFWARDVYRAKIKKPFELIASTARALDADAQTPLPMVQWANRIGEPLYLCQPPTGYSDKAEAWVNTGALLNRLNFALALAGNRLRGTRVNAQRLLGASSTEDASKVLDRAIEVFLAGQISPQTRATLEKQLSDPQVVQATLDDRVERVDAGMIAGLVLGSPEFQRR